MTMVPPRPPRRRRGRTPHYGRRIEGSPEDHHAQGLQLPAAQGSGAPEQGVPQDDQQRSDGGHCEEPSACVGDNLIQRLAESLSHHLPLCGIGADPKLSAPPSTPPNRCHNDPAGFVTPASACSVRTAFSADYQTQPEAWTQQTYQLGGDSLGSAPPLWPLPMPCAPE